MFCIFNNTVKVFQVGISCIGSVGLRKVWNAYTYGYAFLLNNVAYAVIGIVTPEEQEQFMIDEIKQKVDALMETIHDEYKL